MELHIRIATDAGRPDEQSTCRRLFGRTVSVWNRLKLVEDECVRKHGTEWHRERAKHSERSKRIHARKELHELQRRVCRKEISSLEVEVRFLWSSENG